MTKRNKPSLDLPDWLNLLNSDDVTEAMDAARDALQHSKVRQKQLRHDILGFISESIRKADAEPEYLRALKSSPIFLHDQSGPRKIHVTIARYILGITAVSGREYELARSYGNLAEYFSLTDWEASRVADYVERHGIRNTLEYFQRSEKEAITHKQDFDSEVDDDDEDLPGEVAGSAVAEGSRVEQPKIPRELSRRESTERALSEDPPPKVTRPKLNINTMLVLDTSEPIFSSMFELNIEEARSLRVRRKPSNNGQDWFQFVVDEIIDTEDKD